MKISSINCLQTKTGFKSGYADSQKNTKSKSFTSDNSNKIIAGMAGLAVMGAVLAGFSPKNNNSSGKIFSHLKEKFSLKPELDPIVKKLNGKRDAEAVKLYNAYKAQTKIESLRTKVLNGEFDKKSSEVFQHLIENEKKLERTARFAV